jgi:cytochrome P450
MCITSPARISTTMEKGLISMRFLKFLVLVFSIWIPMNGSKKGHYFIQFSKGKSIEIFLLQIIQNKLENCLLPFLDHQATKGIQVLDLQDILERFTFDTTCISLFGFDPNFLPYKINDLSDIAYLKAISVLEDMILLRHYLPKCIWKLQKWLKIGQEKKGKVAQENLHQFLNKCINYYKGDEEKRLRKSKDVDGSHSCLLSEIMKEGLEKGEIIEKYIRDTAVNLLIAGNGTISSGLSWFFWLVSTHPIVEAPKLFKK